MFEITLENLSHYQCISEETIANATVSSTMLAYTFLQQITYCTECLIKCLPSLKGYDVLNTEEVKNLYENAKKKEISDIWAINIAPHTRLNSYIFCLIDFVSIDSTPVNCSCSAGRRTVSMLSLTFVWVGERLLGGSFESDSGAS